jgi:hypothetical protein
MNMQARWTEVRENELKKIKRNLPNKYKRRDWTADGNEQASCPSWRQKLANLCSNSELKSKVSQKFPLGPTLGFLSINPQQ